MAGAISAGSYTAGVIDFLIEALDAVEAAQSGNLSTPNTPFMPPTKVELGAMSGASAGAMITAITAAMLGRRITPFGNKEMPDSGDSTDNPFYDSWVQRIHYDKLLGTKDLTEVGGNVRSVLNSSALDPITQDALKYGREKATSAVPEMRRVYVRDRMPIFICLGNLRGVVYSLGLDGLEVGREHQMSLHADYVGFSYGEGDKHRPDLLSLKAGEPDSNWQTLGDAALASGAFPAALEARPVTRPFADYEDRLWQIPGRCGPKLEKISPFPVGACLEPPGSYEFLNVDGGTFNNEPLELCRIALAGSGRNPRESVNAHSAVIMIDPFPNLFKFECDYDIDKERGLLKVLRRLPGIMISQARFKADELALARDPDVASRYVIAPTRSEEKKSARRAELSIACGTMGGFGGFLSRRFRHHDYMLGRRNCQQFLRKHFVLPADPEKRVENPLMKGWASLDASIQQRYRVCYDVTLPDGTEVGNVAHYPVIPLLGGLACNGYTPVPKWPTDPDDICFDDLQRAVLARANLLIEKLIEELRPGWFFRQALRLGWRCKRHGWIRRLALEPISKNLEAAGLLKNKAFQKG